MGRFGISAYSRNQDRATIQHEELLVDKKTGQMLIKTKEIDGGDIVSYDNIITQQQAIQAMQNTAILNGLKGDIHSVDLELGVKYPIILDSSDMGSNILVLGDIDLSALLPGESKNFFLSFNIMSVLTNEDGGVLTQPTEIDFELTYKNSQGVTTTTKYKTSAYESSPVIDIGELGTEVKLTSLKIVEPNLPTLSPDGSTARYRHILTNFLIFLEKEGI